MSQSDKKELEEEKSKKSKTMNGRSSKKLKKLVLPNDSNVAKGNMK